MEYPTVSPVADTLLAVHWLNERRGHGVVDGIDHQDLVQENHPRALLPHQQQSLALANHLVVELVMVAHPRVLPSPASSVLFASLFGEEIEKNLVVYTFEAHCLDIGHSPEYGGPFDLIGQGTSSVDVERCEVVARDHGGKLWAKFPSFETGFTERHKEIRMCKNASK